LVAICSRKVAMNAGQPAGGWLVPAPARECRRATQNGSGGLLVSDYSEGWEAAQKEGNGRRFQARDSRLRSSVVEKDRLGCADAKDSH